MLILSVYIVYFEHHCFIRYVFFVSASPLSGSFVFFLVSCPIPTFYAEIPAFYANIPCYLGFYAWYHVWCAVGGGEGPCVDRRRLQPCMWCYLCVYFNLLVRSPIPGPSPAPVPTGDWGAEIRGSSVCRTSQRRL